MTPYLYSVMMQRRVYEGTKWQKPRSTISKAERAKRTKKRKDARRQKNG